MFKFWLILIVRNTTVFAPFIGYLKITIKIQYRHFGFTFRLFLCCILYICGSCTAIVFIVSSSDANYITLAGGSASAGEWRAILLQRFSSVTKWNKILFGARVSKEAWTRKCQQHTGRGPGIWGICEHYRGKRGW